MTGTAGRNAGESRLTTSDPLGPAGTFVLLHGAGSDPWYWHRVVPLLAGAGHAALTVNLPVDDDACGLEDYAATVVDAVTDRSELVLVAQSMAAFTAPIVAARLAVRLIVLVAPMVPAPGETPGQWWANTGQAEAAARYALEEGRNPQAPFDPVETFLHDIPPPLHADAAAHARAQSDRPFADPWPLDSWPDVATRAVIARRDRLFPLDFQRRVLLERLGLEPNEIDSGHLPALARPDELSGLLLGYWAELTASRP